MHGEEGKTIRGKWRRRNKIYKRMKKKEWYLKMLGMEEDECHFIEVGITIRDARKRRNVILKCIEIE